MVEDRLYIDRNRFGRTNAIPAQMNDSLEELIDKKLNTVPDDVKEEMLRALEISRANRAVKNVSMYTERQMIQLTYQSAADLADELGIEMKEVLENMGLAIKWPNEDAEKMAGFFDGLEEAELKRITPVVEGLSPVFWRPGSAESPALTTPTKRMLYIIKNRVAWKKEIPSFISSFHDPDLDKTWNDRKGYTLAPHKTVLAVGNAIGVSPGWLMMLADGKHRLLSANPLGEYLMAGYLFMGKINRAIFKSYLNDPMVL